MEQDTQTASGPFRGDRFSFLSAALLSLLFFFIPLFPDIRLARPKLLLLEAGLCAVFAWWLLGSFLRSKMAIRRVMLFGPLVVYAAANLLFAYYAPDRLAASGELARVMLALLAYVIAANLIITPRQRILVLGGWMAGTLLAVGYGILQHYGGVGPLIVPRLDRIPSTFGNPIFLGAHLVLTIPLALGLLLGSRHLFARVLLAAAIIGAIYALYLTQSRAAYLGFGAAVLVFSLLSLRRPESRITFIILFVIGAILFGILTRSVWQREQAHLLIWRDTLTLWLSHPWAGTGLGSFTFSFPSAASPALKKIWPGGQFIVNDAHNEYLQVLAETGVAGLGVFLWLVVSFFRNATALAAASSGRDRWLLNGCIAAAAGILTQNIFSVDLRFAISMTYLFFIMGLVNTFINDGFVMENFAPLTRAAGVAGVCIASAVLFPHIMRPYLAQQKVAALPDFFDEKILEPARTIAELEALARKYPGQSLVYEKLAWVYAKQKNWRLAIKNYEMAVQCNPGAAGALNNLGNIYFLLGEHLTAIDCWTRSLAINPRQVDSRLNLATAYYYQGNLQAASRQLKEVLRIEPANEKATVMLKQMRE
jgi:putative inorganic carbon (HCO3(-)) transporter